MTRIIEEYAPTLNFPRDPNKVHFQQGIDIIALEVTKPLYLDQIDQYKISSRGFKWEMIESKLKEDNDKGKLGDEKYRIISLSSLV